MSKDVMLNDNSLEHSQLSDNLQYDPENNQQVAIIKPQQKANSGRKNPLKGEKFHKEAMDKYKLSKMEALKFKMSLQNKNLKLLTEHNEVMTGVLNGETGSYQRKKLPSVNRDNKVFQN